MYRRYFSSGTPRLLVLVMGHQRVGGKGEHLVKEIHGQKIGRKRHPHRSRKGEGKAGEIPGLAVLGKTPHVPYGIGRGYDPEEGGHKGKEETEGVHPEISKRRFRQNGGQVVLNFTPQYKGEQWRARYN